MLNAALTTECPECRTDVPTVAGACVNEIVECPECRAELEVASIEPWAVVAAPDVEEDWGE
jgi:alpha-aminoadipate carrier protein LysW